MRARTRVPGMPALTAAAGARPGRGLEIAGIILGFIWFWPLALAYLVWKMMGYPKYDEAKAFLRNRTSAGPRTTSSRSRGPRRLRLRQHRQRGLRRISPQRARAPRGRAPQARRGGPRLPRLRRGAEAGQGPRGVRRLHGQAPRGPERPDERLIGYSADATSGRSKRSALSGALRAVVRPGAGTPPRASRRPGPGATAPSGSGFDQSMPCFSLRGDLAEGLGRSRRAGTSGS